MSNETVVKLTAKEQAVIERAAVEKAEKAKAEKAEKAMSANTNMYKTGKSVVNVSDLVFEDTRMPLDDILALMRSPYQTREDLDGAAQKASDIMERGLLTPIKVLMPETGKARVIAGHLRRAGLDIMRVQVPARFEEFFPGASIPVHIYKALTSEQEKALATDHGQEKLITRLELYSEVKQLSGTKASQDAITYRLKNILDSVIGYSLKQETKRKEFVSMEGKLLEKEEHLSTLITKYGAFRRGVMTPYFVASTMPKFAEQRFVAQFAGTLEEDQKTIGHGPALKIQAAWKVSLKGGHFPDPKAKGSQATKVRFYFTGPADGEKPFSKHNPNPQFQEVFAMLADGNDGRVGSGSDADDDTDVIVQLSILELDKLIAVGDSPIICELLEAVKTGDSQKVREIDGIVAALEQA